MQSQKSWSCCHPFPGRCKPRDSLPACIVTDIQAWATRPSVQLSAELCQSTSEPHMGAGQRLFQYASTECCTVQASAAALVCCFAGQWRPNGSLSSQAYGTRAESRSSMTPAAAKVTISEPQRHGSALTYNLPTSVSYIPSQLSLLSVGTHGEHAFSRKRASF